MKRDSYRFFTGLNLFADEIHQPFEWRSKHANAVVLVHGFLGTPADMRPLGEVMYREGWTVCAPLLPGFGPDISTLAERSEEDWSDSVSDSIMNLRSTHTDVVVIGHSMGAAIALLAASRTPPDGLVLLAPYWRFGGIFRTMFWPFLRLWAQRWRPLVNANFDDAKIRSGILRMLPDLDLDDGMIRSALRELTVPTHLLDELRRIGSSARKAARLSGVPTLIIQGLRDGAVQPKDTEALVRLMGRGRLDFIDATHNLVRPDDGAWEKLQRAVLEFAKKHPREY